MRSVASVPQEPRRNGGGITRTLATGSSQWRISLAEIERDGPIK
ncbi:HutD family protein [Paraburkholderia aspalathi]|nr:MULTISPECIES: HutD family protein [Paraburkholderia]MCX4158292.1 HutD family protein [Paraburkholderia aspalathi]MDN7167694.1 HutD family protein [Paraburkholderia sp. SECH2]MDQ6396182.1 HutD family protein [Paraburkholderia aspalathi]